MRELELNEVQMVAGGLKWRGRRQSDNVVDMRTGYARTDRFGENTFDPIAQREITGSILRDVRLEPSNFKIKHCQ